MPNPRQYEDDEGSSSSSSDTFDDSDSSSSLSSLVPPLHNEAAPTLASTKRTPYPVTATRVKASKASKIGFRLGLRGNNNKKKLIITTIAPNSLFTNSALQPGMMVLSINGMQVMNDDDDDGAVFTAQDASNMLRHIKGGVTIEAMLPPEQDPLNDNKGAGADSASIGTSSRQLSTRSLDTIDTHEGSGATRQQRTHTITVLKESADQKVGLSLAQTTNGIRVTRVDPKGLFGGQVEPQMEIVSVNNVLVRSVPIPVVRNMIGRIAGPVTLVVAQDEDGNEHNDAMSVPTSGNAGQNYVAPSSSSHLHQRHQQHQPTMGPLIEVVDPTYMMGESQESQQPQPFPTEVHPPSTLPQEQPPVLVQARAYRASVHTKVGLRLRCRTNGTVVMDHIAADGLFANSPNLGPGMVLQSFNGVPVTKKPHAQIIQMITQAVGEIHVVAAASPPPES